ncbi:MAG: glycosyltransferase [Fibromonadales bacterium]|nr:glycosyltransferase [Fibromonadales bacterium]
MFSYPLISIIVPVYKVEPYLRKCVDSIIAQTYTNLEIILVDDGSPDNCGKICDEYAKKDGRVRIVHKDNGGLSDARNVGIETANGDCITFVDSDDYVSADYVKYLYDLMLRYDADISSCNYLPVREDGVAIKSSDSLTEDKFYNKEKFKEMFSIMLYEENTTIYDPAWSKLYKKTLFVDIRFPKGKLFEDVRTVPQLLHKSERVIFGKEKHYFYQIRQNSIITQNFSEKNYDFINAIEEMCQFISSHYVGLEKPCTRRYISAQIRVLRQLIESKDFDKNEANLLRKKILKDSKGLLFDEKIPKRDKCAIFTLLLGIRLFSVSWNIYAKFTNRK